jgi:hypothetical protein
MGRSTFEARVLGSLHRKRKLEYGWRLLETLLTFSREQIVDFSSYEVHLKRFINSIPENGPIVDLQPLFARLSLDTSTAFLFENPSNA